MQKIEDIKNTQSQSILDEEMFNDLKNYYEMTEFAKKANCRYSAQYAVNGFALSIIILFKLAGDERIAGICDLDAAECRKAIEKDIDMLKFMNIDDRYYKELVRRKKIIFGEKENAEKEGEK